MTMTVGELRALLANIPADAVVSCETEGDYITFLTLESTGGERFDLDDLQPGDTFEAVKARRDERRAKSIRFRIV